MRMKPTKRIAVLHKHTNMASAMIALLTPRLQGVTYRIVSRVDDVQPGEAVASIGIPLYLSPIGQVEVISINTRYTADDIARAAQREKINNPSTPMEELLPELGTSESLLVIPMRTIESDRSALLSARVAIFEAKTDDELRAAEEAFVEILKSTNPAFKLTQKPSAVVETPPDA